jgi:hypothetical protein
MASTRYEVKMTCSESQLPLARAWLTLHPDLFVVAYPPRWVNSLYFDTLEMDLMDENLIGVSERSKLRFRWYGQDHSAVQGFLELKCKSSHVGWKEICPVGETIDLTTVSWPGLLHHLREHAVDNVAAWLSRADQPVLINRYMREYYESADRQVRVTIDYDQVVYEQLTYPAPNLTVGSHIERQVVVEVKSDSDLHRRVSDVLSGFPLRVGRNSKYVNGVLESLCFL